MSARDQQNYGGIKLMETQSPLQHVTTQDEQHKVTFENIPGISDKKILNIETNENYR